MTSKEEKRNKRYESVVFSDAFYKTIKVLNEELCQQKNKPRSIHNANQLLDVLLPPSSAPKDTIISSNTYSYLFDALRTQLNYDKTNWVYAYWRSASQYRSMNTVSEDIDFKNKIEGKFVVKNQEEVDKNKKNNKNFEEFHIWLAAMVLYKEEYDLLGKILSFSQSQPTNYPLVPSSFSAIVDSFTKINMLIEKEPFRYYTYYFTDTQSINRYTEHQGLINKYFALLLFRLNSYNVAMMNWRGGWDEPHLPKELRELNNWKEQIKMLLFHVKRWDENREHEAFKTLNNIPEREKENNPISMLDELTGRIEEAMNELQKNVKLDKKNSFISDTNRIVQDGILYLKEFTGKHKPKNSIARKIGDGQTLVFKSESFSNKAHYTHINATTALAQHYIKIKEIQFSDTFLFNDDIKEKSNYRFYAKNAFKAIDKLVGKNKDAFVIINLGVFIGHFIYEESNKIDGISKTSDDLYMYNNIKILNFKGFIDPNIKGSLVVIHKDKLPYMEHRQPTKEELQAYFLDEDNKIDDAFGIYAGITKATDKEVVRAELLKEDGINVDNVDKYCIASIFCSYDIYWEKDTEFAVIKVLHKLTDSLKPSNLEDVKPLPLPKEEEK